MAPTVLKQRYRIVRTAEENKEYKAATKYFHDASEQKINKENTLHYVLEMRTACSLFTLCFFCTLYEEGKKTVSIQKLAQCVQYWNCFGNIARKVKKKKRFWRNGRKRSSWKRSKEVKSFERKQTERNTHIHTKSGKIIVLLAEVYIICFLLTFYPYLQLTHHRITFVCNSQALCVC